MTDPYRPKPERQRYTITVNGHVIEGEHFREIAEQLRALGLTTKMITDIAGLAVMAKGPVKMTIEIEDLEALERGTRCRRCQGVGVTRWAAFVSGLAWLLAGLVGADVETPPCPRCGGTGRVG